MHSKMGGASCSSLSWILAEFPVLPGISQPLPVLCMLYNARPYTVSHEFRTSRQHEVTQVDEQPAFDAHRCAQSLIWWSR